jgi:menaquinone-dependent protoporphyrinogen oxidase
LSKILVAYATMAGSTAEVAKVVGEEIAKSSVEVDILPISQIKDLEGYNGIVLGGPMILGFHRGAIQFLKKHRAAFERVPLAVFVMAMSLTKSGETSINGVPVYVDERLPKPPKKEGSLSFRERYALLSHYLQPILSAVRPAKPASVGVFGGRLEYGRLKWWAVLFAMLIVQAQAGEKRNWPAIRAWAAGLPASFHLGDVKMSEAVEGER